MIWVVPSTFWMVFVDGSGVLRKVLGLGFGECLEECLKECLEECLEVCLEEGLFYKNRGVGFVGDCCYLCMIYILSVVCLGVRGGW